ncbi:MAG: xylB 3, partial [Marmoricola sp.]|nr:xylB 3 [Marmoricola sp.]
MTRRLVAGLDLGSTGLKMLVTDEDGTEVLVVQRPTPWRDGPRGTTDMDASDLVETLEDLFGSAATGLQALAAGGAVVEAIAISGMGETGILVDPAGAAVAPGIAWFDPRGKEQVDAMPSHLREQFAGRTGLPAGAQVSVAKLLHLRDGGLELRGLRWFSLPEFVAASLGAREVSEYSMVSRTGLLDQDTALPWAEMLDHLGVTDDFLPPLVDAGTDLGQATAGWLPEVFRRALVTVAGHDHLVSAVSGSAIPGDGYHVSMGTAEVLLRVLDVPIPFESREKLAARLINSVRHVVPGQHVVIAGVKTGLLMRRALRLSGVSDRPGRDQLDDAALALPLEGRLAGDAIEVRGARN